MTGHWPFWAGGVALAAVAMGHWLLLHRQLAVSGRFTALVNRLRHGDVQRDVVGVSQTDLIAALQQATVLEFGHAATDVANAADPGAPPASEIRPLAEPARERKGPSSVFEHVAFLASLVVGGWLATHSASGDASEQRSSATLFAAWFGATPWLGPSLLLVGGCLVGFGTRMAGGCTSGHGLCGVSRFQSGSLAATGAFFGAGVATAILLRALS